MSQAREAELASLFARWEGAVRRLARAYEADPSLADDLVQEIFLALWGALPAFRGAASPTTYLFRIAHNRALRHVARRRARRPVDASAPEAVEAARDPAASPEHDALESESRARLLAAIRRLRESLRHVVVLRLEGLSDREIAAALDLTPNNVAVRLHRARGELRRLLGAQDGAGQAAPPRPAPSFRTEGATHG